MLVWLVVSIGCLIDWSQLSQQTCEWGSASQKNRKQIKGLRNYGAGEGNRTLV
jgi:hypothetical protein